MFCGLLSVAQKCLDLLFRAGICLFFKGAADGAGEDVPVSLADDSFRGATDEGEVVPVEKEGFGEGLIVASFSKVVTGSMVPWAV